MTGQTRALSVLGGLSLLSLLVGTATAQHKRCDLNKDAHTIMKMCCGDFAGGGHRRFLQNCQLPKVCPSKECATFYGDFYSRCRSTLASIPGVPIAQYNHFEKSCQQKFPKSVIDPNANGEIVAFDSRNKCNMDQRIDTKVLNTEVRSIRAITVDGSTHRWDLTHTTLEALLHQNWHGIAGENDQFKLLARGPNSSSIYDNLYMFNDGDAANHDPKGCPAANMNGRRQDQCPGTPDGLISMAGAPGQMNGGHPNKAGLTGDYGSCNVNKKWGFLVVAMYVTPTGFPPPPPLPISSGVEVLAFDNNHHCWVDQRISPAVLNRRIRSVRVQRVDGKVFRFDILTKEGSLHELLKQEWHGIAGENDAYKLLAGDSPHPKENLYLFNDGDIANYDKTGCPKAGVDPVGQHAQTTWAGTPLGLISMGHDTAKKLTADYGESNYRKEWGWVIRKMWVTPSDLPGGESIEGCYQDCGLSDTTGGTMKRVCDDKVTSVTSVESCHKICGSFRYMGFACPTPGGFECWCCNALDADSKGSEALIPQSECAGGKLTSGVIHNNQHQCVGFKDPKTGKLTYSLNGYSLGGACRAEIYSVVAPKIQDLSFQGCYQDCGKTTDGGVMNRVCDDTAMIKVTSVGQCHAHCRSYTYLAMACPMSKGFECWCCNSLDNDNKGRSGLIPETECRAGQMTSGVYGNRNAHCSGFAGAGAEEQGQHKKVNKHDFGGFLLGGACRAAVYNVVEPANVALFKPTLSDTTYGPSRLSCSVGRSNPKAMCVSSKAVDGDTTSDQSRWISSPKGSKHWLIVNLQRHFTIQRIKVYAGQGCRPVMSKKCKDANLKDLAAQASQANGLCYHTISVWTGSDSVSMSDAAASKTGWTTIVEHKKPDTRHVEHINMRPVDGRLVKLSIDQSKCRIDNFVRLYELEIFGTPAHTHGSQGGG